MLEHYKEAGFDVLIGLDPVQGTHTDMALMKDVLGDQICLWGGVSAAVTVERGTGDEIRTAVDNAIETLGPAGFILSPIDNLTVDEPQTWKNIAEFIDAWKLHW
jgi:uroporphyrinogen-III decarboxylase